MKKHSASLKQTVAKVAIGSLIFISQMGSAQATGDIATILNQIRASLDSIVNTAATYIFQTPPNIGNELVTNNTLHATALPTIPTNLQTMNEQDISQGLAPKVDNPNLNLITLSSIKASDTVLPSLTMGGIPMPFFSGSGQQAMQNSLIQGDSNFNFQSLLSPIAYDSQDLQTYALNYIHFISGYAVPISNLNLNTGYSNSQLSTQQKIDIQNSPTYQLYQVQRRQMVAQQSAALSNLYWIYARRLPITTIQANDTAIGKPNPSVAQIEEYNATWRTSTPTWYTQMATSSQTNVEREMLFLLAEIQTQLYQLHRDNERMIALTAISQLSGLQTAKQTLAITEKTVQDSITQKIQSNAANGTTNENVNQTQSGKTAQQQNQANQLKQVQEQAEAQAAAAAQQQAPNAKPAP